MFLFCSLLISMSALPVVGDEFTCDAGFYLIYNSITKREDCFPCSPGHYQNKTKHRERVCHYCTSEPQLGDRMRVIRPCTWTSNTEFGCLRKGEESYNYRFPKPGSIHGFICMPCTVCLDGEVETMPCTEFTNRECQVKTPTPTGSHHPIQTPTPAETVDNDDLKKGEKGRTPSETDDWVDNGVTTVDSRTGKRAKTTAVPSAVGKSDCMSQSDMEALITNVCAKTRDCDCKCTFLSFFDSYEIYILLFALFILALVFRFFKCSCLNNIVNSLSEFFKGKDTNTYSGCSQGMDSPRPTAGVAGNKGEVYHEKRTVDRRLLESNDTGIDMG